MLRIFNYLFKQQREVDAAQNAALREMTWLVVAAAQDLTNLTKRVSELTERLERLESNIEKTP
jgi:polyhydroxyalkanoate synthesis regulator phasin